MSGLGDFLASEMTRSVYQAETSPYELTDADRDDLDAKYEVFREITVDFPTSLGIEVSKLELTSKHLSTNLALTYGEIGTHYAEFQALGEVFKAIEGRFGGLPRGKFYDLGSVLWT